MTCLSLSTEDRSRLLSAALEAVKRAYAPYSQFKVGAAVLTKKGNLFAGCNVENASYGLTICAERVAIGSAVAAEGEEMEIHAIAVVNQQKVPCSPCGACRQVIFEFGVDALVIFQGRESFTEMPAAELLPDGFRL
ncbi:cytidine deaminase [Microcoleus sp. FACHB-672]|uniref:cytidine deaminase n=1 Tax=Microcoleus sp. FACHB-672 TaxID=2692825 RepID=UPI00168A2B06|nr:cytidine deaminase [Microcoleus sp. FACHB-672]MBD2042533.1 cytidine deaminase [Microcoleus sp. FACHB-672]